MTDAGEAMRWNDRAAARVRPTGRWVRVAAALVAGVAAMALSGCGASHPLTFPSPDWIDHSATAVDGGRVRVVEFGFQMTAIPPDAYETGRALAAVVLENTSKRQQSQGTELTVRLLDPDGRSLFDMSSGSSGGWKIRTPAIPPGGRIGVGILLATLDNVAKHRTATRMEATVGNSDWRAPNDKPQINISNVKVTVHADGTAELDYTAKAPPDLKARIQAPLLHLLYRDAAGTLLGGTSVHGIDPWTAGTTTRHMLFTAQEWKYMVPTGVDLSRTEVYGSIDGG
jgi:hypothetical protein